MELRQIECFNMVCKHRNFTKAAEQLYVSQPAITKAIHGLEKELNVRLFDRDQKRVSLTAEGYAFLTHTERILSNVKEAITEMSEFQDAHRGTIKLGVPPMIGAYLFPNIIANFAQLYPCIDFQVFEDASRDIVSMVETGELDLAIAILPEDKRALKHLVITQEEYVLCVHPKSPLTHNQTISFRQIKNEPFILLKPGSYQYHAILQRCSANDYTPHIILTSNHFKTIKGLVASGVGVSFLMRMVADEDSRIVTIPLDEPLKLDIGLVWSDTKYLPQPCRTFIRFIKEYQLEQPFAEFQAKKAGHY